MPDKATVPISDPNIDSTLQEQRVFECPEYFRQGAHIKSAEEYERIYRESVEQPEKFWGRIAAELHWFKKWDKVLEWSHPWAKWFSGGQINLSYNCLDSHVLTSRKNKAALIWESEPGEVRTLTYQQLHREVQKFANVLKSLGVKKGDRVALYMGMTPELAVAMLACARIGAPHTVVFGGFSSNALIDRIHDSQATAVVTQDGAYRRGAEVKLFPAVEEALKTCPSVKNVVVYKRTGTAINMEPGRDHWWHDVMSNASDECPAEPLDAEHPLYILYTSGTTGKPKGVVHTTGGYSVGTYITAKWVFDLHEEDTYWCTADIGWVTGHSYIVYGPLMNGATSVMYEGAPNFPEPDRFWRIIDRHKVNIFWQTETGHIMITPLPGAIATKPGSATKPFPGVVPEIVTMEGEPVPDGSGGFLVLKQPWPGMLRTIYGDPDRYVKQYWSQIPPNYFTGDGARKDKDGYFWVMGRVDDVINVSGHRLSTMEVESALVAHPAVAEAAVVGRPDEVKGQAISAFVTLGGGRAPTLELKEELRKWVAKEIGSLAKPDDIRFTDSLPKTRSGKIMRRLLRELATNGEVKGDTTTLEDFSVIAKLKEQEEA